jgi:hypothetical protein
MQFRTTLDQAGRIAGLAGELGTSEGEVMRRLIDRALEAGGRELLAELRLEIARDRPREPTDEEVDQARAEGRVRHP